ncbi:AIDA repeat-containing protein, partial [Cronobacter sakazakii]
GKAIGTQINNRGTQAVDGTAISAVVKEGGTQIVNKGGLAKDTQVNSGGLQHVSLGGASADAHLFGGTQQLA